MEAASALPLRISVLIADDHELFVEALDAILAADDRFTVSGHAHDGREAVELAARLQPDVVLMDISMPVMDGIEATVRIREERAGACVLMLTGSNSSLDVDRARRAGAAAYVTKDRIAVDLVDAILDVVSR
jgi:DNA-binding NarL/FixJ family response regulator